VINKLESNKATRRGFVSAMTALSAASYNRVRGANDRVGIGFIGYGLIGKQHITNFKKSFPDVDRVAMCDAYKPRLEEGTAYLENPGAKSYSDFRKMYENKDIDAVVVATPDHWHALLTIMACAAGKDVYVEKPLTVCIDEGKWMIQAMQNYKRIVVVGTQRNHNPGHQVAKKIVESGTLGKLQMVKLAAGTRNIYPGFGQTPLTDPPPGFDYDMWLGPAPKQPFRAHRGLYHFRWFWDYSGGQLTNLGAHSVAAFLLVTGTKGPTKVVSFGGRFTLEDDGETPDLQECLYQFPDFMMTMGVREANGLRDAGGSVIMGDKGNLVLGSNQVVPEMHGDPVNQIPRFQGHPTGGPVYNATKPEPWIEAQPGTGRGQSAGGESLEDQMFNANKRDWINCIKSRNQPFCGLELGHRTATICNLGNMSLRLGGRTIHWDAEKEVVVGDKEAAAMCSKPYRAPWDGVLRSLVKV
jgi:predicted dehydrogenase